RERAFYADSAFFQIFSFGWLGGDAAHALDAPYSVVLTESLAQKIFGQEEPVGQTIRFDDDNDYQVHGVIADVPDNSHITFQLLISAVTISAGQDNDPFASWGDNWVPLYALLQPDVSWEQTSEKIQFALKTYQGEESKNELYLRPLSRIHLHAQVMHEIGLVGSIKNIYIFTAVALFVLIIAGINFMNLTTARSADRAREVGLRKVSGAQRTSLIRQFLGESVYTAFFSLIIAFVLIAIFLPEFNRIVNRELHLSLQQDWPFFLGVLALTLLVGVLAGIYPAFVLSSFQPASVLKGRQSTYSRSALLRKALVVFQFFVSVTLISGTIIVLQQVHFLLHKDLGYDSEQVLTFPIFIEETGTFRSFRSEVLKDSNVVNVAAHDYMPHSSSNWTRVSWEGAAEGEWMKMNVNYVDQELLDTYGMTIVAGRGFSREFGADQGHVVVLNEAAVKHIGWEEPVGKNIRYWGDYKHTQIGNTAVVGVVKDFHFLSLHNPVTPLMLRLYPADSPSWSISIKVREQDLPATIAGIEARFQ
ncbi:MAG: ABC transporter permease, partial [Candidatus Aminicenantaceae bacterium]